MRNFRHPRFDGKRGGPDNWALELAGRAEAAWGLAEAMAWADEGSEIFVISQIGYTRGIIASVRDALGQQALTEEDNMHVRAQAELGLGVAEKAKTSFMGGGVSGLMNFGVKQAASNRGRDGRSLQNLRYRTARDAVQWREKGAQDLYARGRRRSYFIDWR